MQAGGIRPCHFARRLVAHLTRRCAARNGGVYRQPALTACERALQGFSETCCIDLRCTKTVLHHLQHIVVTAHRRNALLDAGVALGIEQGGDFLGAEVRRNGHGKTHHQTGVAGGSGTQAQIGRNAERRVTSHRLAATTAVQLRRTRIQQLEVVGELGHGADCRPRAAHRIGLVDRDCGWHAFDAIHLRFVHAVKELARIRRKGLDVAALTLGVERVEHQR